MGQGQGQLEMKRQASIEIVKLNYIIVFLKHFLLHIRKYNILTHHFV